METSKQILEKAGIKPKLQLGLKTEHGVESTGPHTVKLLKDKETMGVDEKGTEVPMIRYLVEEDGVMKTYDVRKFKKGTTDIHYLVQRFAGLAEGTEVVLEMKKKGIKNYIEVRAVEPKDDEVEDDIPVINEDADITESLEG